MFQSIKYLNSTYDNKTKLYHYHYEITDSDFISNSSTSPVAEQPPAAAEQAASVIKEYEGRKYNHKEIISNLFLLNMFLLKDNCGYKDLNQILELQHEYLIKKTFLKLTSTKNIMMIC